MRLEVHPLAIREIQRTARDYDKKAYRVGDRFVDQVEHAFARLREHPLIGEERGRGERRLLLRRFPCKVIYRVHPDRIAVVAVAHHKRREGYWHRRKDTW